jgi:Rad3-related DNA helicase
MIPLDSYPAESWRPNQRDGAELICAVAGNQGDPVRVGIDAPCGSGKSLMALRAAFSGHCPPMNLLSTTRAHLKQYELTLVEHYPQYQDQPGGWAILRGRSFYSCCGSAEARKRARPAAVPATFADDSDPSEEWTGSRRCQRGDGCYYRQAILRAGRAAVVLQCTIGFLYRRLYWNQISEPGPDAPQGAAQLDAARRATVNRAMCILDEAHEYLRVRREFETTRLAFWPELCTKDFQERVSKARTKGNYRCSYVLLEPDTELRHRCEAEIIRLLLPEQLEKLKPHRKLTESEWSELREKFALKLRDRLALFAPPPADADYPPAALSLQFNESARGPTCELVAEPLFARVKEPLAERAEVFMSATLECVSRMLKIAPGCVRRYPEIFDWGSAVTVNPLNDPNPESRSNAPLGAEQLEALFKVPGRPLTLVLYMAKAHANAAVKGWGMRAGPALMIQSEKSELGDLIEAARAWDPLEEGPAPMLISYGGWVGTDLPGEKWLVLGSAPKSPISPHHEARQMRGRGNAWNDGEKMSLDRTQLAQGLGRALRSESDIATLIWIDSQAFRDLGLDRHTGRIQD